MIGAHRNAFQPKLHKSPLDINLEQIVINAQLKMKEMIKKKEDFEKETDLLIGKNEVVQQEIEHLHSDIKDKEAVIESLSIEFDNVQGAINELSMRTKEKLEEYFEQQKGYKEGLNSVNEKLELVKDGTVKESSSQKAAIKQKCEEYLSIQKDNALLKEILYMENMQLYALEMAYKDTSMNMDANVIKAQNGIELIHSLYDLHKRKAIHKESK